MNTAIIQPSTAIVPHALATSPEITPTVQDAWESYKTTCLATADSLYNDVCRWEKHLQGFWGHVPLAEVKNMKIVQFRLWLQEKDMSSQTVQHCLAQLRRILRKAVQWELYPGPVPIFDMPKFDNRRTRFLSPSEATFLLERLKPRSHFWHDLSLFALHTGLRAGEIFGLRQDSVNMQERLLFVVDTKSVQTRAIHLNEVTYALVAKHQSDKEFLFHTRGKQITSVSKTFFRVLEECGFNKGVYDRRQKVVFHTLRHTFASWLVQAGQPIAVVSSLLGHKSLDMTMRYAHLCPDQGEQAVNVLMGIFPG